MTSMMLNDEEQDILAGKSGPVARQALQHQRQVGEFFGAQDFVPVTQATLLPIPRALARPVCAGRKDLLRPPNISDLCAFQPSPIRAAQTLPRRRFRPELRNARLGATYHIRVHKTGCRNDRHLHQLSDHPGAHSQRARRLWRHRRGHLFQLSLRGAVQFRGWTVGVSRRPYRAHAALWLSPSRTAPRDPARSRGTHSRLPSTSGEP